MIQEKLLFSSVKEGHGSTEWHKTFAKVQKYPNSAHIRKKGGWQARLFVCSSTSGEFSVEQIFDYAQEDLEVYLRNLTNSPLCCANVLFLVISCYLTDPISHLMQTNNVYILDTWAEVFVWIGSKSYEEDERMAMETALVSILLNYKSAHHLNANSFTLLIILLKNSPMCKQQRMDVCLIPPFMLLKRAKSHENLLVTSRLGIMVSLSPHTPTQSPISISGANSWLFRLGR